MYRGYQIQREQGKRDVWYNVILDGVILHRAATANAAAQWIDKELAK